MKITFPALTLALLLAACATQTPSTDANILETSSSGSTTNITVTELPEMPDMKAFSPNNLIPNPGAEEAENPAQPRHWTPDSWGDNTANLSWASKDSFSGEHYLSVTMANHKTGDAKWVGEAQKLEKGSWYEFSDYFRSDGRSRMILGCTSPGGQRSFKTVWQAHKSTQWKRASFRFYNSAFKDCSTTIMHILDRDGFLHTDHQQLLKVDPAPLTRPLVSITFDDIWKTAYTTGLPELEKRSWKGSFYITSRYTRQQSGPEYANDKDLKDIIQRGHEVGSHSQTHPLLTTLENNQIISEVQGGHTYAKNLGAKPEGIAYPFGDFAQNVEDEVKRFHNYARTSLTGLNDKTLDPYRLKIIPITAATATSDLFTWVDDAEATKTWVIFLFHDLKNGADNPTYTSSSTQYIQLLDYIQNKKLTVLPVDTALKEVRNQQN